MSTGMKMLMENVRDLPEIRDIEMIKTTEVTPGIRTSLIKSPYGMGWLRDLPDVRDFDFNTAEVKPKLANLGQKPVKAMLKKIGVNEPFKTLPAAVDLRAWCAPIENQQNLGSCTANAGVGLVEYYEKRASGTWVDASRIFLYKVTRRLLGWTGDTGAYLRTTMGALVLFGAPPERYCPYVVANFDREPDSFLYALAQNYQALSYYRLDPAGTPTNVLLDRIKTYLYCGLPSMFGFTVYNSIWQDNTGKIPFPAVGDQAIGGHAVDVVGYDDNLHIKNNKPGSTETVGALLIRNSWGTGWGMQGYGWLPYQYVLSGLAVDWWSIIKNEWVETGQFGIPSHG